MLSVSTSKRAQSYHHGDLRPALLAAAADLLADGGVTTISLREVARRAGVSHNAPYRHFADRDSLLAALAEEGFAELGRRMDGAVGGLAALGQCYVHFALEQPGRFALMFASSLDKTRHSGLQQAATALYERLADAVGEAAPGRDRQVATLASWSLVHGLAQLLQEQQMSEAMRAGLGAAELSERVTRLFVEGL